MDKLTQTALAADRFRISCRAAAALINAFQQDIGRVTDTDIDNVVSPNKIWRTRKRVRSETAFANDDKIQDMGLTSLYFDGRKDPTCTDHTAPTEREEHVVVLSEPGGHYVTHFTPLSGKAEDLLRELYLTKVQFGGVVQVLGCDGTAVNTGSSGGVCRLFELVTARPVHWFVCQLHSNELLLRKLFHDLDGSTSGPRSFSGPIGKACGADVWQLDVTQFAAVPGNVPAVSEDVVGGLSHDQQQLYRLARDVQTGSLSSNIVGKRIGTLNHARLVNQITIVCLF